MILKHLMLQIGFWYLSGSLRQPLGASGSLREAFSKVLASVPGSPIPLRGNDGFEPFLCFCGGGPFWEVEFTTVSHFDDFDQFNGRDDSRIPKIYEVSVTYCDFGVVREFSALPSIL
jgi:hypothetical protein